VLEGESEQTIQPYLRLFQQRALPDLGDNIKCGNSLIGPEDLKKVQLSLLPEEDQYRINGFDWISGFPGIMKAGGFDVVIGNPPYIRIQTMKEWAPTEVDFYKEIYSSAATGNYDIYVVFVERVLSLLNKRGKMGFILPHRFFNAQYGEALRHIIAKGKHLSHIVHFGDQQVFSEATTYSCLLFLSKPASPECDFVRVDDLTEWKATGKGTRGKILPKDITASVWNFSIGAGAHILKNIHTIPEKLGDVAHIFQGLVTGADKVFIVPPKCGLEIEISKPFLQTGLLTPYATPTALKRIIFPYKIIEAKPYLISVKELKRNYPKTWKYFLTRRDELMNREHGKWRRVDWYAFGRSQNLAQMEMPKLIIQVTAQKPTVLFDDCGFYMTGGGGGPFYGIRPKDPTFPIKYLLGILNSSVLNWLIRAQSTNQRGGYIRFSKQYIE
jgi:hypothetical protein